MSDRERQPGGEDYPQLKLENQLCFPLYAAARKAVNAYTPYLKPLGLTNTQYIVFLAMWETGKATVGDLCRRLHLDCGTITPLLKKMEESGWISRCRCQQDERVVYVSVTEEGWKLRDRVAPIPEKIGGCMPLPAEDAAALYTLLYRLMDQMD